MKKLIFPYYQRFIKIFEKEKNEISKVIRNAEIYHIGSTAVPDLGGKGIIDILIGIKSWQGLRNVMEKLKGLGFKHIHSKERGRVFLSKVGPTKLGDVHIHIVIKGGKPYKELLAFRDYLRKNKREIKRFFKLKLKWGREIKGDRAKYNKLKEKYVKEILKIGQPLDSSTHSARSGQAPNNPSTGSGYTGQARKLGKYEK